ncbi:uncharacterized protein LOC107815877 [Nicotiana tabacum]|uniref:Uncharacterized protein LOC107815877 n=1 Tax=Nicotiana tabacum TaxID=4097 RepID=A0A1S4C7T9_TOBAC|nr:PREDICTED: uncharacterized protein LOC107815877 [Nicotiana tabacum]
MLKACKASGVNIEGFEHEIMGIILRMDQKRQMQLQKQKSPGKEKRRGKKKQEARNRTGKTEMGPKLRGQIWGNRWVEWAELKSVGNSGGIIILWDKRQWANRDTHQGVYGPHTNPEREELWLELAAIRSIWNEQWVIGGDFNVCRYESERYNCVRRSRAMVSFSDIIQDLVIIDLPLQGAYYTWFRGEDSLPALRIYRFLISPEWCDSFKAIKQLALLRVIFDHRPLLLECGDWEATPSYFKFENMWQVEGFIDKVKNWWQSYVIGGSPDFILVQKLRRLKADISNWNIEEFGRLETQKTKLLEELAMLEQTTENRTQTQVEKEKLMQIRVELQQIAKVEEVLWRQKSRCLWLKAGDRNTKFFQKVANSHKRNNYIDRLKIGEEITRTKNPSKLKS